MIGIGRNRAWRAAVAASVVALAVPGPAWGWGRLGHRMAGKITEARLTPAAQSAVRGLLAPGETIADISTWADDYRRDHPSRAPGTTSTSRSPRPKYDAKFMPRGRLRGRQGRRVPQGPGRQIRNAPREPIGVEALKLPRIHFVQDMHQPVHVGHRDDRGGNQMQVQFFGQGSNLHRVWDSGLLERPGAEEAAYVAALEKTITPDLAAEWSKGSTVDWADESLALARKAYRNPIDDKEMRSGARLLQPYQDAFQPEAERRVAQAGVRLAWILNDVFK